MAMILNRWLALGIVFLLFFTKGSCDFRFTKKPVRFASVFLGSNHIIDCSTNDPTANITLWKRARPVPSLPLKQIIPDANHVIKSASGVFTIKDAEIKDAGQYKCKAVNDAGQEIEWGRQDGMLFLKQDRVPQVSVLAPLAQVLTTGANFNFTCKSESVVQLKWLKRSEVDGSEADVPLSKTTTTVVGFYKYIVLMITNAKESDTGTYKCLLTYGSKKNFDLARLDVFRMHKPVINSLQPVDDQSTVKEGASITLLCRTSAYPASTIKWMKNNKEINIDDCAVKLNLKCKDKEYIAKVDRSIGINHDESLTVISTAFPEDHGNYTCEAHNHMGTTKKSIFINVQAKPVLKRVELFLAPKDIPWNVDCTVDKSNPLPTFKWEYQDKDPTCLGSLSDCPPIPFRWKKVQYPIAPGPSVQTNVSVVTVPGKFGPGYLRCTATNKFGSSKLSIKLQRLDKQSQNVVKIKKPGGDKPMIVDEMETVRIRCVTITQLVAFNGIRWYYQDIKWLRPKLDPRISISSRDLPDNKTSEVLFKLVNTTVNDTGLYTCDGYGIRIMQNKIVNDSIYVTVKAVKAPVIPPMKDITVKREDTTIVTLLCNATGHPRPNIKWYKQTIKGWRLLRNVPPIYKSDKCIHSQSGFYHFRAQRDDPLVICRPRNRPHSGRYRCEASNKKDSAEGTVLLDVQEEATIESPSSDTISLPLSEEFNETCIATGNPLPEVQWTRETEAGRKVLASGHGKSLLSIKLTKEDFVNYTCTATNYKTSTVTVTIEESIEGDALAGKSSMSGGVLAGIIAGCAVFVIVILIICFVIYRRQKKQIDEYKDLYFLRTGDSDYKIDPDRSLLEQCNNLPYDMDWEFPEERLILGKILGQGAFGQVLRAEAIGMDDFNPRDKTPEALKRRSKMRRSIRGSTRKRNEYASIRATRTTVAVKCLKEGASESDYKDLASELKILIHLGEHKNIVNVLGACTRGRRVMLIIEFAPHGNLLSFLRARREVFHPIWTKTTSDPEREYTLVDLAMAAYQVSKGVEFLASRKCVHRDLAARNVLVGPDYTMKVSDFGLARDIYQDDLYVKNTSGLLPVKWMALESLFDRVYTEKSDVWSFGILLWEIFTLGGTPYPGLPTEQLLDYLSEGQRMTQPQNCPLDVYTVMRDCWMQFPDQRPGFATLADRLGKVLERNVAKDNPYIQLVIDESTGTTDYYLNPCDMKQQEKKPLVDGYEEALPTPLREASQKYDSPLPSLPRDMSDDDLANSPLPSIPPSYEEAVERAGGKGGRMNSESSNESGIDMGDKGKKSETEKLLVDLPGEPKYVNASEGRGKGKGKGKRNAESLV